MRTAPALTASWSQGKMRIGRGSEPTGYRRAAPLRADLRRYLEGWRLRRSWGLAAWDQEQDGADANPGDADTEADGRPRGEAERSVAHLAPFGAALLVGSLAERGHRVGGGVLAARRGAERDAHA